MALLFSSCKKDYTCSCEDPKIQSWPVTEYSTISFKSAPKNEASYCESKSELTE